MTIKKLKPVKSASAPAAAAPEAPAAPATGGATIADRFKLDLPDPNAAKAKGVGRKAATAALVAGLVALGVAGVLTFVLFQHWEFLKGA
jgi:hypothetical protein